MADGPLRSADERAVLVRRHDFEASITFAILGHTWVGERERVRLVETAMMAFDTAARITTRELSGVG